MLYESQIQELEARVAKLEKLVGQGREQRFDFQKPFSVTLRETIKHFTDAEPAKPRLLVGIQSINRRTGQTQVTEADFTIDQLIYGVKKFAKLERPCRKFWKGNRWMYGIAHKLFLNEGVLIQHQGSRVWSWAKGPDEVRHAMERIVTTLHKRKLQVNW